MLMTPSRRAVMNAKARRVAANLARADYVAPEQQIKQARTLQAEWQSFLARCEFEFKEDALSHDLISLEEVGLEESGDGPRHGFQSVPDIVEWFSDGEDSRYETN